ncbi:acyltransferase domain-containing protein [Teredinibacter sp. KSP-S5-2]|uniref:acyltransferase domain-containing protein n=1 Tax=Teredinibacter sp. KSP-S5-2 TaxID=3034506 RepID=UPI002934D11C|nr:acyltransferase domain-containing protein [Teredinibacter sp. KSP-S5-2]WNO11547.1 acyltransferase domain-containing protein [Teredinibacter sp. KSP-S5-2]
MNKPIVFMFPGQGSQYYQMGRELYENNPYFHQCMSQCALIIQRKLGVSLIDVLYGEENKTAVFDRLLYSNPALLAIEYSIARTLINEGIQPDYLLGYSLGEFAASVMSGALTIEEGLSLVIDYAQLLEKKSPRSGMIAVIESADFFHRNPSLFRGSWLSAKNFQNNFVVTGLDEDVNCIQSDLSSNNVIHQRLPVNYGFHTPIIELIEAEVKGLFNQYQFSRNQIPSISCANVGMVNSFDGEHLWRASRNIIRFDETIAMLLNGKEYTFIDVGPTGSMSMFLKYMLPPSSKSRHYETMNQFGRDVRTYANLIENMSAEIA